MVRIRPEQVEALAEARRVRFVRKLAAVLIARYPELREWDGDELLATVRGHCEEAWRYGLSSEAAVGDFADLAFQLGARFHEHPDVQAILADPATAPDRFLAILMHTLTPPQWQTCGASPGQPGADDLSPLRETHAQQRPLSPLQDGEAGDPRGRVG